MSESTTIEKNPEPRRGASFRDKHPRLNEFLFSLQRLFSNPLTIIGVTIILFFAILAIFAPLIAPPEHPDNPFIIPHDGFTSTPSPPSAKHIFGTLPQQYDIFYGIIWGARLAFGIGLLVTFVNMVMGVVLGSIAGYFGGIIDEIIMRIVDIFYAIPFLPLSMAMVVVLHKANPELSGIFVVVFVLIILRWTTYTRVIRSEILVIRDSDYVQAARAAGSSHGSILLKHILPNSIFSVIIVASMQIGTTILTAAALSFLGLGAGTDYADWGAMVATSRNYIVGPTGDRLAFWYLVFIPGFAIALFVLGWNLLGDAIRDVFDPKMRRR